jgi:succinate-semialdehyde dehydrogenase
MTKPQAQPLHQDLITALVAKARHAQAEFENFSQETVDAIVRDFGKYVYDQARPLSEMACTETGLGNVEDKVLKKIGKSRAIWNSLKGKKSRGVIDEDPEKALVYIAKPMGVVGAVTPITNPIVTPMCNAMFALKAGNAIVFAPHPKAQRCAEHLTAAFQDILRRHGAPVDLVQVVVNGSVHTTQALMKQVDVVVATGGGAMVKSAYSSGRPSLGVGAGNVPVIIDRDADLADALRKIEVGASFDNGIICSHEQFVLIPAERMAEAVDLLRAMPRIWYSDDAAITETFRSLLFVDGALNKEVVGKSCRHIGALAGLDIPEAKRLIVLHAQGAGRQDVLAKEKLCPVIVLMPYGTFEEAVELAKENLVMEGAGHTAGIHSQNQVHIAQAGVGLPVSRLVVNQPCATTAGGSLTNGLAPTTTLGCGSWGNNSISENLDFKHLMNVSRVAGIINKPVITDVEIWK